jgi:hypothetical protein
MACSQVAQASWVLRPKAFRNYHSGACEQQHDLVNRFLKVATPSTNLLQGGKNDLREECITLYFIGIQAV